MKTFLGLLVRWVSAELAFKRYMFTPAGIRDRSAMEGMRGKFCGKRCVIVGNGPSLNLMDLGRLRGEITICCNAFFLAYSRIDWRPTLYTVEDSLVCEDRKDSLKALEGSIKIAPFDLHPHLDGGGFVFSNFIRSYPGFPRFSFDLLNRCYWGGTVTYMNLQLAAFLGCNPIYLIGVDHSYRKDFKIDKVGAVWTSREDDRNHFDPSYFGKGTRWHDPCVDRMEVAYRKAKVVCEKRGIKIVNATIGGQLEVYPRGEFESISGV